MILPHLLSTVSFVLTLLFASFVLRAKHAPGNALAWLAVILVIPYLGIPAYLFLSTRKLNTKLQRKPKAILPFDQRRGNAAQFIVTGESAYQIIIDLIEGAQHRIHLTTFIFENDEVGIEVLKRLELKAKSGIQVRVLVDSLGATWANHPSFKQFVKSGGEVAFFMPVIHLPFRGRANLRNHRKILIVDSQKAVTGGMNLGNSYLGPPRLTSATFPRWVDLAVLLEGDSVHDLERIFIADWAFARGSSLTLETLPFPKKIGSDDVQIIASGPDVAGDALYDSMITLIYRAEKRIRIVSPYFIPDESLTKALELAAKRGVSVHILIPKKSNHFLADLARGSYLEQLFSAGVQISFYPKMSHAKLFIVDDVCSILGSANFDMRSLLYNFEVGAALYSWRLIEECQHWFKQELAQSTPYQPKGGVFYPLIFGLGRVIGPLI